MEYGEGDSARCDSTQAAGCLISWVENQQVGDPEPGEMGERVRLHVLDVRADQHDLGADKPGVASVQVGLLEPTRPAPRCPEVHRYDTHFGLRPARQPTGLPSTGP